MGEPGVYVVNPGGVGAVAALLDPLGGGPQYAPYYHRVRVPRSVAYRRHGYKKNRSRALCITGRKPEKKFINVTIALNPPSTGVLLYLPTLAVGTGMNNRIGRKAVVTNILCKGHISTAPQSSGGVPPATSNQMRLDVVQDMQPNKAAFAVTDYLATADINSYRNLANAGRFKTLFSRVYTWNAKATGGNGTVNWVGDSLVPFNVNVKCCIDMEYDADAGTIGTCVLNSIYMLWIEERATPGTNVNGLCRLRFMSD